MIPSPTTPTGGHPYKYSIFVLFKKKVKILKLHSSDKNLE